MAAVVVAAVVVVVVVDEVAAASATHSASVGLVVQLMHWALFGSAVQVTASLLLRRQAVRMKTAPNSTGALIVRLL